MHHIERKTLKPVITDLIIHIEKSKPKVTFLMIFRLPAKKLFSKSLLSNFSRCVATENVRTYTSGNFASDFSKIYVRENGKQYGDEIGINQL